MITVEFGNNEETVSLKDRIDIEPVFLILWLESTTESSFIKALQVEDIAGADCKYNEIAFELVNENDEDLDNGKVFLLEGNYNYKIYQSDTAGTDINGKKLLEKGLLRYPVDTQDDKALDNATTDKTLRV